MRMWGDRWNVWVRYMQDVPTYRVFPTSRPAWTLVEILVSVGIIAALAGALLIGSRAVNASRRGATAKQQLQLISAAIDRYAEFWPKWKVGAVAVSDEGWPDAIPGRVFATCNSTYGPFEEVMNFNVIFYLTGPDCIYLTGNILNANTCLAYQLRAASGRGPLIKDGRGVNLVTSETLIGIGAPRVQYPGFDPGCVSGGAAKSAEVFLDPWKTPIRYFWVYRDVSRSSHRGYLPVDFAPLAADSGPFGVFNAEFNQPAAPTATQIAAGYVLESAGPDQKFGNVWKINPTQQEIDDARDNITIVP